jgi:hypothetical protein
MRAQTAPEPIKAQAGDTSSDLGLLMGAGDGASFHEIAD